MLSFNRKDGFMQISNRTFLAGLVFFAGWAHAQNTTVTETVIQETREGSISSMAPDYEIVNGSEEILGDPTLGAKKASYDSWKAACKDWKQEMKELNKDNIISLNCGSPKTSSESAGSDMYTTRSTGVYKVRVRIKDKVAR